MTLTLTGLILQRLDSDGARLRPQCFCCTRSRHSDWTILRRMRHDRPHTLHFYFGAFTTPQSSSQQACDECSILWSHSLAVRGILLGSLMLPTKFGSFSSPKKDSSWILRRRQRWLSCWAERRVAFHSASGELTPVPASKIRPTYILIL